MPTYVIKQPADVEAKIPAERRSAFFGALATSIAGEVDPRAKLAMQQLGARAFCAKAKFSGPPVREAVDYTWTDTGK